MILYEDLDGSMQTDLTAILVFAPDCCFDMLAVRSVEAEWRV